MLQNPGYEKARALLLEQVRPVESEILPLEAGAGRRLAAAVTAVEHVPPFDRSPYDGYAFRSEDTAMASAEKPVTLSILEELPAGAVPTKTVTAGTAVKVLTGAPIPPGADAVIMFEKTEFTDDTVTLFAPVAAGENIVRAGEDIRQGQVLARRGQLLDPGLVGTLAAQGLKEVSVRRRLRVGILSTGSELVELGRERKPGSIYNSNRHTLAAVLREQGFETVYLGLAGDSTEDIRALFEAGLRGCDAVISTGGVSVGDFDLTPAAMEAAGAELWFRGVNIKPGMACAYGGKDGKLICALSGNPASSLTNFYVLALPALRKMAGWDEPLPAEFPVTLTGGFKKKSPSARFLRGRLDLTDGTVRMILPADQGNVVLSSAIGCDMMAVVPAGSGPVEAGTLLKGFRL